MRIKVEDQEVLRKEKELESQVRKPADARKYQVMTEADAEAYRAAEEYKGKVAGIKLKGLAEAEIAKAMGSAEAGAMREKAGAWAEYNQAAMYQTLIEKLPELARAVSEPLSNIDRVVMIGSGEDIEKGPARLTGQIGRVLAQLPEVVSSLSDIDLVKLVESLPKKKDGEKSDSEA
jgi:flotillin